MKLNNKTALVTGGGSGIGLAISKALIAQGVKVIICGRNKTKLEKAKEQNPKIEIEECDITSSDQVKTLLDNVNAKYGGIDILINNAGMFGMVDYANDSSSFEDQLKEIEIDFIAPIQMLHHFLPMLKSRPEAAVVNVSSALAYVPFSQAPVYCASKAALHSWTKSFRYQMKESSIKVFELLPPLVETPMVTDDIKDQKMMQPDVVAAELIKGIIKDKDEITPGQSGQLKMMSRVAPSFIFNAVNKQFS